MSLSLADIKGEFREGYQRTEAVLSGMDTYITKLEKRIIALETKLEKRVDSLESQLADINAALYQDESGPADQSPKIFVGQP